MRVSSGERLGGRLSIGESRAVGAVRAGPGEIRIAD